MRKLLMFATGILLSANVLAADFPEIKIVNLSSSTGSHFAASKALSRDLEKQGYRVELISPGNACQAGAIIARLPRNTVVISNPSPFSQAEIVKGIQKCNAVLPKPNNMAFLLSTNFTMCTLSQKQNPNAVFQPGANFRVGHMKPTHFWKNVVDQLNTANQTNNKRIQYNGAGPTKAALLAQEIDYGILATPHALALQKNGAVCFAEFTNEQPTVLAASVNSLSSNKTQLEAADSMSFIILNANNSQLAQLRTDITKIMLSSDTESGKIKTPGAVFFENYSFERRADIALSHIKRTAGVN